MPFVRIDTLKGHYDESRIKAIGEAIQQSLLEVRVPLAERFQVFSEKTAAELRFDPTYMGIERTDGFVVIQIFLNLGRSQDDKKRLFAALASNLSKMAGVLPGDLLVNLVEVVRENWSFGNGEAQLAK
jgi:4-oxalocrotonate tautomerase